MAEELSTSEPQRVEKAFWQRRVVWLSLVSCFMALGFLWWKCKFDSKIYFLPQHSQADWIVFPSPPSALARQSPELVTIFKRSFELKRAPDYASISLIAFRDVAVILNGQLVDCSKRDAKNWKDPFQVAAPLLRAGTNEISVVVTNRLSPPALNLLLQSGDFKLRTDAQWQVAIVGSAWRTAKIASTTTFPRKGNPLAGGENSLTSINLVWPWLLCAILFSAIVAGFSEKITLFIGKFSARRQLLFFCGAIAFIWLVLFFNNVRSLSPAAGFDSEDHVKYIEYILKNKSLPLARDGWEMFQPPLYYLLCAVALKLTGLTAASDGGLLLLRCFGLFNALAQSLLVLVTLRFIFPEERRKQLFGFVLAAFVPPQIYLAHYISNETLSALLVTAALCTCAYIWRRDKSSALPHIALGVLLGLALLAKLTALIGVVVIFFTLVVRLIAARNFSVGIWFRTIGLPLLCMLLISSWHYVRVWKNFGTPFIGNWDEALGWHWWQHEGFRTSEYYFRFGRALIEPLFSGIHSFADGIYSTLWADGLCGGRSAISMRPPWNYDVMAVGCLIALVPTLLIFCGALIVLVKFFKRPSKENFLFLALAALTFFAVVMMSLRVPSYAQSKAFYGMTALASLSFFGALGFDAVAARGKAGRFIAIFLITFWAANNCAAFWIKSSALPTRLAKALTTIVPGKQERLLKTFSSIAKDFPNSADAHAGLAGFLDQLDRYDDALAAAETGLRLDPNHAKCHLQMASALGGLRKWKEAAEHSKRAVELAPESVIAWQNYSAALIQLGQIEQATIAAREGLAVEPDSAELHVNAAVALTYSKNLDEAIEHCLLAVKTRPGLIEPRLQLGYLFSLRGQLDQAIQEYQKALKLKPDNAQAHNNLSDFLRRQKRFDEAFNEAQTALQLNPNFAEAHFNAANALAALGKNKDAIKHYSEAVKLRPNMAHAHYRLGVLFQYENNLASAVFHWREALRLDSDWPEVLNELAWLLATSRDDTIRDGAEAVTFAEKAVKLSGTKTPGIFDTLAAAYAEAGRFEEAVKVQTRTIEHFTKQPDSRVDMKKLKERLQLYQKRQPYRS